MTDEETTNRDRVAFSAWKDEYSVGDETIDSQHRNLLNRIETLYSAIGKNNLAEVARDTLAAVETYAIEHLEHEEMVLRDCEYPDLARHVSAHNEMRHWMKDMMRQYEVNPANVSQEMPIFLKDWWVQHIRRMDAQYASYLERDT